MKFERTDAYEQKLFEKALFDEKNVIRDATVYIEHDESNWNKLKAYCPDSKTYLQFPRALREYGAEFVADVVEVHSSGRQFYRAMNGSIRRKGSDEIVG